MTELLHVKVTTKFGTHERGDELAVKNTPEVQKNIAAGYYEIQKVEQTKPPPPTKVEKPKPATKAKAKPKTKAR